jgi:hypothetical protein
VMSTISGSRQRLPDNRFTVQIRRAAVFAQ